MMMPSGGGARVRAHFRGVQRRKSGRWSAEIRSRRAWGRRRLWIGTYDTAEEAARAYDAEARRLHGAKAKTNFPPPPPTAVHDDHVDLEAHIKFLSEVELDGDQETPPESQVGDDQEAGAQHQHHHGCRLDYLLLMMCN